MIFKTYVTSFLLCVFFAIAISAQQNPNTYASLFFKKDSMQLGEIFSSDGDLYKALGHHGPAIENQYMGLRLYFNNSGSIDVYSKTSYQLELKETKWYPDSVLQANGYGSDKYMVGPTVGLGGIKLWDGERLVNLEATKGRLARIKSGNCSSTIEMLAKAVPYKDDSIDVLIRVTIYSSNRFAEVEAIALSKIEVQFATGINYHSGNQTLFNHNYAIVWGTHPEDVAISPGEIGSALILDKKVFVNTIKTKKEILYISKPCKMICSSITSVSGAEKEINSFYKLQQLINSYLEVHN